MARFRIHPLAEDDVADVLAYTLERFGLGRVEVLRLLHDSMDVARHIPRDVGED